MNTAIDHDPVTGDFAPGKRGRIAFDTWCLGSHACNHGVHVYASKLLEHLRVLAPHSGVEVVPYTCTGADNNANLLEAAPGFIPQQTALLKFNRLWRFGGACALAALGKMDLVFSPHSTSLYVAKLTPHVVTIHDVIPAVMLVAPRGITGTLRFCLAWSAKFSRAIIAPSLHSKGDLISTYKVPENKVTVVYEAYDKAVFNRSPADPQLLGVIGEKIGVQRPYILHHGMIKPNKNLKRLVQSYHLLRDRNRNAEFDLVLAGPPGWRHEEVVAEANRGHGHVIFTGALDTNDLAMLIKGASLAVFPSIYEGFCLPMLEAMACGVPVIAANSSCLPEISGGMLRYFNPESVEEMSACMEEALEDAELRRELSEKGIARAAQFSWRRCAQETLAVLKEQLANDN